MVLPSPSWFLSSNLIVLLLLRTNSRSDAPARVELMIKVFVWWAFQIAFGVSAVLLMSTEALFWALMGVIIWAAPVLLVCANCHYPIWLDYEKDKFLLWLPRFPSETCARCRKPVDHRLL